ncbi:MAG TPA: 3-isopropylmalate dehydratase small subunit [Euryarchaeota archaeon]|nr:3-isopropylmalate dehydratase small subunit [Euryarchaeota archaeon]
MNLKGKAHKFGDSINTDYIISGKYKFKTLDMDELATHVMEDLDPDFCSKVTAGDFIVAGKNFGLGSSREQAPLAIKHAKISAVIARSFARIFFRNAINTGLPILICRDADRIDEGDELEVDLSSGLIINRTKEEELKAEKLPPIMIRILEEGGLAEHLIRHGGFEV